MNEFYARVDKIREELKLTKGDFAKRIGVTSANYANLLKGKTINGDLSKVLYQEFKINLNWLIVGSGEMFVNIENTTKQGKFISFYDSLDEDSECAILLNKEHRIYKYDPFVRVLISPEDWLYKAFMDNDIGVQLICIEFEKEMKYHRFIQRNTQSSIEKINKSIRDEKISYKTIIIKNNLLGLKDEKLDSKYFGAIWQCEATRNKIVLKPLDKRFQTNFNQTQKMIEELKDFLGLYQNNSAFLSLSRYAKEDIFYNRDECFNKLKNLETQYLQLKDLKIEMSYDDFEKLEVIALR